MALATYSFSRVGIATFLMEPSQGEVPHDVGVGTFQTQTDRKCSYPDGSLRAGVVTTHVTALGQIDLAAITSPVGPPTFVPSSWPTASVAFNIGGTNYTATLPSAPLLTDSWLVGPYVHESRVIVAPSNHPLLQVIFDVRSYVGGGYRVDVTVQNARWVPYAGQVPGYTVVITIDGTVMYTTSVPYHQYGKYWRKVFLTQGLVEAEFTPDYEPQFRSKSFPRFLASLPVENRDVSGPEYGPMQFGGMYEGMASPGGREEIGFYPAWAAKALMHPTPSARAVVYAKGMCYGAWSSRFLDADGVSLLKLTDHPNMWWDGRSPAPDGPYPGTLSGAGSMPETAHLYSLCRIPYAMTGDRFYLDNLKASAALLLLQTYNGPVNSNLYSSDTAVDANRGGAKCLLAPRTNEPRGFGWGLRELTDAAISTPDADPTKSYFVNAVNNNLKWSDDYAASSEDGGFIDAVFWEFDSGTRASVPLHKGFYSVPYWQLNYYLFAVDRAMQYGFISNGKMRNRLAQSFLTCAKMPSPMNMDYTFSMWFTRLGLFVNDQTHVAFKTTQEFYDANYKTPADVLDGTDPNIPRGPGNIFTVGPEYRHYILVAVREKMAGADDVMAYVNAKGFGGVGNAGYALAPFDTVAGPPSPPPVEPPVNPATITITARIVSANEVDKDMTDNSSSVVITPHAVTPPPKQADQKLTVVTSNAAPEHGDTVTLTAVWSNKGPDPGTGNVGEVKIPAGLTYVGHMATQGTYDPSSGLWTVGTVAMGSLATLTITASVN